MATPTVNLRTMSAHGGYSHEHENCTEFPARHRPLHRPCIRFSKTCTKLLLPSCWKKTPSLCTQKSLLQLLGTTEKIAEDWILHNSRSPSSQVTESIDWPVAPLLGSNAAPCTKISADPLPCFVEFRTRVNCSYWRTLAELYMRIGVSRSVAAYPSN